MMTAGVLAEKLVQRALAPFGYSIRKITQQRSYDDGVPLPEDAAAWLRRDNPALVELHKRYTRTGLPVSVPSTWWSQRRLRHNVELGYFRGDNAYVYGYRKEDEQATRMRFLLLARYIAQHDPRGLLQRLEEDGAFGCWSYKFEALPRVSRDLLDSISEIYFLDRRFSLFDRSDTRILDIGAGYGRLAHRIVTAVPTVSHYYCTDAIADSTFLCDYYLKYRGVADRAHVVPLDEFVSTMKPGMVDLAVNIHSFSECTLDAITWWLRQLMRIKVPYLMLIPNEPDELLTREHDDRRVSFRPVLEQLGFEEAASELIYQDSVISEFIKNDRILLFRVPTTA